jgi:hypothetical protein
MVKGVKYPPKPLNHSGCPCQKNAMNFKIMITFTKIINKKSVLLRGHTSGGVTAKKQ